MKNPGPEGQGGPMAGAGRAQRHAGAHVVGTGQRERRVPLNADVASVIKVYLLAERPESDSNRLFLAPGDGVSDEAGAGAILLQLPDPVAQYRLRVDPRPRDPGPLGEQRDGYLFAGIHQLGERLLGALQGLMVALASVVGEDQLLGVH